MAACVLKPLVRAIDTAHTNVIETAARIGWQGVQLQPLDGQAGEWHSQPAQLSSPVAAWCCLQCLILGLLNAVACALFNRGAGGQGHRLRLQP